MLLWQRDLIISGDGVVNRGRTGRRTIVRIMKTRATWVSWVPERIAILAIENVNSMSYSSTIHTHTFVDLGC